MTFSKTSALVLCVLGLSAGVSHAQGAMTTSSMAKPMSASDTKMMKSCQAMDHDMMMKKKSCVKMMKGRPSMTTGMMTGH